MSTALSPSSDTEPRFAIDLSVIAIAESLFTSKTTSTCSPANSIVLDAADLHAGDAHRRPGGEAGDVGEAGLQRVALPEEALGCRSG